MKEIVNKIRANKIKYRILMMIILISVIILGTAILTSTLNINGKTKIKENNWTIYFDNVRKSTDSVELIKDTKIVDYGKQE